MRRSGGHRRLWRGPGPLPRAPGQSGVVEVDRPNRQARRRQGKSDPLDAVQAARAALVRRRPLAAKANDGAVEAIRVLLVTRRSATQGRNKALVQMRHLVLTGPDELRVRFKISTRPGWSTGKGLRPLRSPDQVTTATKTALRTLAQRIGALDEERGDLDQLLAPLVAHHGP